MIQVDRPRVGDITKTDRETSIDIWMAGIGLSWFLIALVLPISNARWVVWITCGLIAVNVSAALWGLLARKRILVWVNITQVLLFGLVHYQIHSAYGAGHYTFDREPGAWSWAQFTFAHLLRAVDVLDALEEYRVDLQNVKHASNLSAGLLVVFHITTAIFLLTLIIRAASAQVRRWTERSPTTDPYWLAARRQNAALNALLLRMGTIIAAMICAALLISVAIKDRWGWQDGLIWPLDNALRAADIGDAMQIYHWRLHPIATDWWAIVPALGFRLLVGIYLAEWFNRFTLQRLGHRSFRTIEDFTASLDHADPNIRGLAAEALGKLGPDAIPAVPALIKRLADTIPAVRERVMVALEQIDPNWRESSGATVGVDALVTMLAEYNSVAATWALGEIGVRAAPAAIPCLIEKRTYSDQKELLDAVQQTLQRMREALRQKRSIATLARCLTHSEIVVRRWAIAELNEYGPEVVTAVPELIESLADPDHEVPWKALELLTRIGPTAGTGIPRLVEWLDHTNPLVRSRAARVLGAIGPTAVPALPALIRHIADSDDNVSGWTISAIGSIGPAAAAAVPALIKQLECDDSRGSLVSTKCVVALGNIGPKAAAAIPALVASMSDDETHFKALEALNRIDAGWRTKPIPINAVLRDLNEGSSHRRLWAARTLGEIGPAAVDAIAPLVVSLAKVVSETREVVEAALTQIAANWPNHPRTPTAVAPLIRELITPDGKMSRRAWEVLARIDGNWPAASAAQEIGRALIEKLADIDPAIRSAAAEALGRTRRASPAILARLRGLLTDAAPSVREAAESALRSLGA